MHIDAYRCSKAYRYANAAQDFSAMDVGARNQQGEANTSSGIVAIE